jgi:large subunit ribosomal protein L18
MRKYLGTSEERRKHKVRLSVRGQGKPRLSVFRSGSHIYAQLIDDHQHKTLVSAGSLDKEKPKAIVKGCEVAGWVGSCVAGRAVKAGITHVVFDRGSYRFHGRVKALADAAREAGLSF